MKTQVCIALFASFLLAVAGCKTQKSTLSFAELAGAGEWNLIELNGNPVNEETYRSFFTFNMDKKQYAGNAGCNRMSGELNYDDAKPGMITFGRTLTTRMACPDLKSEQALLAAMQEVIRFEAAPADGGARQLVFLDKNGVRLFVVQNK